MDELIQQHIDVLDHHIERVLQRTRGDAGEITAALLQAKSTALLAMAAAKGVGGSQIPIK